MTRVYLKIVCICILCAVYGLAVNYAQGFKIEPEQAPAAAPALTEVQRLKLQNAVQQIEITQLRLAIAQRESEQAKQDAQGLFKTLVVDGWNLDLATLVYTRKPEVKK